MKRIKNFDAVCKKIGIPLILIKNLERSFNNVQKRSFPPNLVKIGAQIMFEPILTPFDTLELPKRSFYRVKETEIVFI